MQDRIVRAAALREIGQAVNGTGWKAGPEMGEAPDASLPSLVVLVAFFVRRLRIGNATCAAEGIAVDAEGV